MASDAAAAADGSFLLMTPHINEMSNIMWWQIEKKPFVHVANITIINAQRDITPIFFSISSLTLFKKDILQTISTNR